MKHVGFVTCAQFPHLTDSDSLTIAPLKDRGIDAEPIIWSSPPPTLNQFDAIIMRSAWDYHLHPHEFIHWLNTLKENNIHVFNSVETMLWNSNKNYLFDLASKGVSIIPTIKIHSINDAGWQKIKKWSEIIIKPVIGASAFGITKLPSNNKNEVHKTIATLLKVGDVIIQPFMKEIYDGEFSFIFFDKQYSHAMLKTPKAKDFRTQEDYGATCIRIHPHQHLIDQSLEMLSLIKDPLLYARLDAIEVNGSLQLMELELIEPHLFLEDAPEKAVMFADAILQITQ